MCPLPGARMIPVGWSKHHATPVRTSFNCVVTATTEGTGPIIRDPDTGAVTPPPRRLIYTGPARLQRQNRTPSPEDATHRPVIAYPYLVQLEAWATAEVGMHVEVTSVTDGHDPSLVGTRLTCMAINQSTESFTRDIWCDLEKTGPM